MATKTKILVCNLFNSYEELEAKVTSSLDVAQKRVPKRVERANSALVYYSIHYVCVFGRKSIRMKGLDRDHSKGLCFLNDDI